MLTVMKIKALKPKEKRYEVTHKTGLVLVVSTNGRKTWKVNKSVGGKRITERLGDWPQMGIADAVAAMEALTAKNKPVVQQTNERTFGAIFEEWMELKKANVKNWADIEQRMEKDLLPLFKERSFASITPPEVIKALRTGPLARGKAETVRRLCGYLSEMERFAVNSGYAEALKFTALHEVFPNVKHEHFAAPEPAQLPDVLKRLQIEAIRAPLTWAAILIGFYSLLRPGEYCALRWDWIEDDVITVPAEHMKMKRPFRVPITPQLQHVLADRPHIGDFVLCAPEKPNIPYNRETSRVFMQRHGFSGVLVPHGIRSVGRIWMQEQRVDFEVAEMCLAHTVGNAVSRAYGRSDLLEERRAVMEKWCSFVESGLKS